LRAFELDCLCGVRRVESVCRLVAVSAGVIGVEQAGVSFRAVVRSVLWSEVRSAGVRRRSIIRIRIRKKQDTRKHVKAITRPWT
jgi:hypothetical protein